MGIDYVLPFTWIDINADASSIRFRCQSVVWQYSEDNKLEEWFGVFDEGADHDPGQQSPSPWSYEPVDVIFDNQTSGTLNIHWVDNEGRAKDSYPTKANKSRKLTSWLGRRWRISLAESKPEKFIICELTERRYTTTITQSPTSLSIEWHMDKPLENNKDKACRPRPNHGQAIIRAYNIWLESENGDIQVSYDGGPENGFKSVFQSPDGSYAIGFQVRRPGKSSIFMIDVAPTDQFPSKLIREDYPRAGDNVELKEPRLFNLVSRQVIVLDSILFSSPYTIVNIGRSTDSQVYWFLYNQRGHQPLRILGVHIDGTVQVLVDEASDTFIDYNQKLYYKLLPSTNELIWASERDNFNHLYMFNLREGGVTHQITKGNWNVRTVHRVDCQSREIWFECIGVFPEQDPYYSHLARVDFGSTNIRIITEGDSMYSWKWSPTNRFIIDSWSRTDMPPRTVVRESDTGKAVVTLSAYDLNESGALKQWMPPERFATACRDNTIIYSLIIRPTKFDPTHKYPV